MCVDINIKLNEVRGFSPGRQTTDYYSYRSIILVCMTLGDPPQVSSLSPSCDCVQFASRLYIQHLLSALAQGGCP